MGWKSLDTCGKTKYAVCVVEKHFTIEERYLAVSELS